MTDLLVKHINKFMGSARRIAAGSRQDIWNAIHASTVHYMAAHSASFFLQSSRIIGEIRHIDDSIKTTMKELEEIEEELIELSLQIPSHDQFLKFQAGFANLKSRFNILNENAEIIAEKKDELLRLIADDRSSGVITI